MSNKLVILVRTMFTVQNLTRVVLPVGVLLLLTARAAYADGGCGGFDTAQMDAGAKGFLNVISGTPFRIGAGIAVIMGLVMVLLDGGQLPQFAKWGISAIVIVLGGLAVVGFLVKGATCGSF